MVSHPRVQTVAATARRVGHACYRGARVASRVGAVLLGLVLVVLALLGLPHVLRRGPVQTIVADSAGSPAITHERFLEVLAALTGGVLKPANRVEILSNGDETFPRLYQDLSAARRSITMQMYYQSGGVVADSVRRILTVKLRLGLFDEPYRGAPERTSILCEQHLTLAQRAARESLVLLKNEAGILPLGGEVRVVCQVPKP